MVQSEEIRSAFVKRLKQALAKAGIAEWGAGSRLAEIAKKTPKAASKWLNGETMPGRASMQAIADELHVSIQWLQYGEGEMLPGDASNESNVELGPLAPVAGNYKALAAAKVMKMLQKHGKGLSAAAQKQIADAVADSLKESGPASSQPSNVIAADFSRSARIADGDILILQYDIRASIDHGQVPAEYVEAIRNVVISKSLLQEKGVTYSSPSHLAVITGWGQSMEGTINDKDPVIVDRGVNEYVGDGVYVITWAGHLFIKRLQLAGENKLELISDNPNHKDRIVPMDEVTIHAKVLLVWNARKL